MRLNRFMQVAMAANLLLTTTTAAGLVMLGISVNEERDAAARQMEFRHLGQELAAASDYLTAEARRYTIFGDQHHYDNYWREVKETKTRDRVVAQLQALGALPEELALIEEAKANSDALIAMEDRAMEEVAAGRLGSAQAIMFGERYDQEKAKIMEPIAEFQQRLNARAGAETVAAHERAVMFEWIVAVQLALLTAMFLGTLYLIVVRRVVRPLGEMTGAMQRLADGDLSVAVPGVGRRDEIGDMAQAMQVFKDNREKMDRLTAEQAEKDAAERKRAEAVRTAAERFEADIASAVENTASAARQLQATAAQMSSNVNDMRERSTSVAASSEQASTNVQTVAAAIEELASSVSEVGRQVHQSDSIVRQAVDEASSTNAAIERLQTAAQRIGEVITLITDIAEKTNLLALNATIEAARAGEAGRGFAVVAEEVKTLANQTAQATHEIGQQIQSVQGSTHDATEAIGRITQVITSLSDISTSIASATEEQQAATGDISANTQQAAAGTEEVSKSIASIEQAAASNGAAAEQVKTASDALNDESARVREHVQAFLSAIRAA